MNWTDVQRNGGYIMSALISELLTYGIKFIAMLACAFFGIIVGKKIRSNKNK